MGKDGGCGRRDQEGNPEESGSSWKGWFHSGTCKWEGGGGMEAGRLVEFRLDHWVSPVQCDFLPSSAACPVPKRKASPANLPSLRANLPSLYSKCVAVQSHFAPTTSFFVLLLRSLLPAGNTRQTEHD